jgi:hypothetical protein
MVSRNPSVAFICAETGAVRQSAATAFQISSPSAYDATAPWAFVQKWQLLSSEVKPAKSSRSPGDHSDGPRSASWSASEIQRNPAAPRYESGRARHVWSDSRGGERVEAALNVPL